MIPGLIRNIGATLADMQPDAEGTCQALSVVMEMELVDAFFYADTTP